MRGAIANRRDGRLDAPRWRFSRTLAEAGFIGALCVASLVAVPSLYGIKPGEVWGGSTAAFAGLPLLAGMIWGRPSRFANLAAGTLLLSCPIIYILTDPLPVTFEMMRDAFFLATSSSITFVSAGWIASFVRSRQWIRLCVAGLFAACGAAAVAVMIAVFMYLE